MLPQVVEVADVVAMGGEVVRGQAVALALAPQQQDHPVLGVAEEMAVQAVQAQALMEQAVAEAARTVDTVQAERFLLLIPR